MSLIYKEQIDELVKLESSSEQFEKEIKAILDENPALFNALYED